MLRFSFLLLALLALLLAVSTPASAIQPSHFESKALSPADSSHREEKAVAKAKSGKLVKLAAHSLVSTESKAVPPYPSPSQYSFTSSPLTIVPHMPTSAHLCMILSDISYSVIASKTATGSSAQQYINFARQAAGVYKKAPFASILSSLVVESSNWDQAVMSVHSPQGIDLYIGGHGSDTVRDWIGQNIDVSSLIKNTSSLLSKIGSVLGFPNLANSLPDIEMRSTRLTELTSTVIDKYTQQKVKVNSITVFGHSMAGLQDAKAAISLRQKYPSIPIIANMLNPGGPGGAVTLPGVVYNYFIPGEILTVAGIGSSTDKHAIPILVSGLDSAIVSDPLKAPVYLHLEGQLLNELKNIYG
jgi:hypothetical protein